MDDIESIELNDIRGPIPPDEVDSHSYWPLIEISLIAVLILVFGIRIWKSRARLTSTLSESKFQKTLQRELKKSSKMSRELDKEVVIHLFNQFKVRYDSDTMESKKKRGINTEIRKILEKENDLKYSGKPVSQPELQSLLQRMLNVVDSGI